MKDTGYDYDYAPARYCPVKKMDPDLRPTIPKNTDPKLVELLERCWQQNPTWRPDFSEIMEMLQHMAKEVGCEGGDRHKDKAIDGFFSALKRGRH